MVTLPGHPEGTSRNYLGSHPLKLSFIWPSGQPPGVCILSRSDGAGAFLPTFCWEGGVHSSREGMG